MRILLLLLLLAAFIPNAMAENDYGSYGGYGNRASRSAYSDYAKSARDYVNTSYGYSAGSNKAYSVPGVGPYLRSSQNSYSSSGDSGGYSRRSSRY